ncbi:MAG TPA: RDD family protein [Streptosporangiaceae bacterium]|jgi:uncharacterized RDD family membrane protein YckC
MITGEAVLIDVPCARFPSRMLAIFIDMVIQLVVLGVVFLFVGAAAPGLSADAGAALTLSLLVLVIVGYPVIFETLSRGRSPGKMALGLRVVGDDGGPERFRQALVRGLAEVVEIWGSLGCIALITSLISAKGKRLGDMFAGTYVIQERLRAKVTPPVAMPPELAVWAGSLELSGLPDELAAAARGYLGRYWELTPAAQQEIGRRIAADVASRVSPPPPLGVPPVAYLAAVIAERSAREQARLAAWYGPPNGYGPPAGYGVPTGYGAPAGYGPPAGYGTPAGYGVPAPTTAAAPEPSAEASGSPVPPPSPGGFVPPA